MIKNIRHIQIKKVAYHPRIFQAIITFEEHKYKYDESDDIEYIKLKELERKKKQNKNYNDKI
tara:strand:- start:1323 stop:1508 length:186 start_codon:yes stop_codon:yes gene_type:complete